MLSLADAQEKFVAVLAHGPEALPVDLFAGSIDRVLLGLKAHANTISHARLVALEETFPLTRAHLGAEAFNRLSRTFLETPAARACDGNAIGLNFPGFLGAHNDDGSAHELAAIEWAWLESYHAPDQAAFGLDDVAMLGTEALLAQEVCWHPATRLVPVQYALSSELGDLPKGIAILVVRPEASVKLVVLGSPDALIAEACKNGATLGNLLSLASEQGDEDAANAAILTLIGAGALVAKR